MILGNDIAQNIVVCFFAVIIGLFLLGIVIIAIFFLIIAFRGKEDKKTNENAEYAIYKQKAFVLRACYRFMAAIDIFLQLVSVIASGLGAYIILLPGNKQSLVAILLITAFLGSSIRGIFHLPISRKAYAKAFRELEFGLDQFRMDQQEQKDNTKVLYEASQKAQKYIEDLYE